MIHEVTTDNNIVWQIDDEDLTWSRWFIPPVTSIRGVAHGQLAFMPTLVLGQRATLYLRMFGNEVHTAKTGVVVKMRSYQREHPAPIVRLV